MTEYRYRNEKEYFKPSHIEIEGEKHFTDDDVKRTFQSLLFSCDVLIVFKTSYGEVKTKIPAGMCFDLSQTELVIPFQIKIPLAEFIPTEEEKEIDLLNAIDITN